MWFLLSFPYILFNNYPAKEVSPQDQSEERPDLFPQAGKHILIRLLFLRTHTSLDSPFQVHDRSILRKVPDHIVDHPNSPLFERTDTYHTYIRHIQLWLVLV